MKIALNTLVLKDFSAKEAVEAAREIGRIEINGRHLPPDASLDEAKRLLEGLEVIGIGAYTGGFTTKDKDTILTELKQYTALAKAIGAMGIRVYPGGPGSLKASEKEYQRAVLGLREAAKIVYPIELYFELHHNDLADSPESAIKLINDIGEENIGVILDPANMYISGSDYLETAVDILGDRLSLVHMKDIKKLDKPEEGSFNIEGTFYSHRLLGEGDLELEKLIAILKDKGYEGYLSLEYHGDDADLAIVRRETEWLSKRLSE